MHSAQKRVTSTRRSLAESRRSKGRGLARADLRLEVLEDRLLLDGSGNYQARLSIYLDGQNQMIPANIGVSVAGAIDNPHTLDTTGMLDIDLDIAGSPAVPTVGDFFRVWRTNAGLAGNNVNATFNQNQLLDRAVDAGHVIEMFVNGAPNFQYENYVIVPGDQIIITYNTAPVHFQPTIVPISTQTVPAGQTLNVPLDLGGMGPPIITVTSSNPNVAAQVVTGNPALRLNVRQGGVPVLLPDFSLQDVNPASATAGQNIGPSFYTGKVTAFYFTDPG